MSEWSERSIAKLKKLWAEGVSASEIAERISGDFTKSAIIGKASRLGLAKRRSPTARVKHLRDWSAQEIETARRMFRDEGRPASEVGKAVGRSRLAVCRKMREMFGLLAPDDRAARNRAGARKGLSALRRLTLSDEDRRLIAGRTAVAKARMTRAPVLADVTNAKPFGALSDNDCRFALNDPDDSADLLFCAAPRASGRPYCAGHCAIAYRPPEKPKHAGLSPHDIGRLVAKYGAGGTRKKRVAY